MPQRKTNTKKSDDRVVASQSVTSTTIPRLSHRAPLRTQSGNRGVPRTTQSGNREAPSRTATKRKNADPPPSQRKR